MNDEKVMETEVGKINGGNKLATKGTTGRHDKIKKQSKTKNQH